MGSLYHHTVTLIRIILEYVEQHWRKGREWKERGKQSPKYVKGALFSRNSIPLINPVVPQQKNTCDCGVFVCRYAYNLYVMRHTTFTQNDITNNCRSSITTNPSFQFNMNDMARIRREMKEVIQNLIKPFQEGKHHAEEGNNDKGKGSKGEDVPSSITMNQHVKGQDQDYKCVSCDNGEMKQDSSSADPPETQYTDLVQHEIGSETGMNSTHSMTSSERAKKE